MKKGASISDFLMDLIGFFKKKNFNLKIYLILILKCKGLN
jgi:hypothetical protein